MGLTRTTGPHAPLEPWTCENCMFWTWDDGEAEAHGEKGCEHWPTEAVARAEGRVERTLMIWRSAVTARAMADQLAASAALLEKRAEDAQAAAEQRRLRARELEAAAEPVEAGKVAVDHVRLLGFAEGMSAAASQLGRAAAAAEKEAARLSSLARREAAE